jgi:dihydrofolate reductase
LRVVPEEYKGKAELISGSLSEVISTLKHKGYDDIYIDGGVTIQGFLKEDLIDEMIITTIPILLGGGFPLFGELSDTMTFDHVKTEVLVNALVQSHYRRKNKLSV